MRFLRSGSRLLCGCLLLFVTSGGQAETDSNFANEFRPVFENLLKNRETAKWVDKILYDLIRHGLDRKTANIIANDEFVKENRALIDERMREFGDYGRNLLRSRGAESAYADNKNNVPGQYAGIRKTAQQLAKFFNFSKEMRSNLNVFVVDSAVVNAFAYGSLNTIELALFTGLIEKLNEPGDPITKVRELVKGTIAHELAHVKNRHSEQKFIVLAIFFAKKRNIIPNSLQGNFRALMKDQAMQLLYSIDPQQALASQQSELYRELFDHSWEVIEKLAEDLRIRAASNPQKFEALVEKFDKTFNAYDGASFFSDLTQVDGETPIGEESRHEIRPLSEAEVQAGQKLLARYGIEVSLDELVNKNVIAAETEATETAETEKETAEAKTEAAEAKTETAEARANVARSSFIFVSFEELIRFLQSLSKLSRSHEVTCDRFEQIATSERTVQESFARIGGGRDAKPEAMMRQAEKWALELNKNQDLQKALNEGIFQTHPVILMRVYQTMLFSQSAALKVHKLPIYKALTLYMEGIKLVEKSEQVMEGKPSNASASSNGEQGSVADSKEAYELYLETERATPFKEVVRNFGGLIADSIIAADASSAEELNIKSFAELVDYLQGIKRDRGDSAIPKKRLSTPGTEEKIEGLLYTLNHRLRHLKLPAGSDKPAEVVEKALELIKPFQPPGSTWELNKETGRWVQIESSSDDTERRRLEDFRRRANESETNKTTARRAAETARRRR